MIDTEAIVVAVVVGAVVAVVAVAVVVVVVVGASRLFVGQCFSRQK